ncbi:MAG: hypothetical protein NT120_01715 [Candidatus Aenigmarchaeota archaeon]|nr:hypothetical protein [Candidatus Aenigmarchaeota archaeon]
MKIDRWILLAYVAAIFNPVPTGVIAGYVYYKDKKYRNIGKIVMAVSIFLFALEICLAYLSGAW